MQKIKYILLIFILVQTIFGTELNRKIEKKLDITKQGKLIVENQFGSINVQGWEKDECLLELNITVKSKDNDEAKRIIGKFELDIKERGNEFHVKLKDFEEEENFHGSLDFNYDIKCNHSIALQLRNRFGTITANDFKSIVELSNTNGTINAKNHADLNVKNSFGSVNISDVNGQVKVYNANGTITVENCKNQVHISNAFGNTTIKKCSGRISIQQKNGGLIVDEITEGPFDCAVQFGECSVSNVSAESKIHNRNGNIKLQLIKGNCEVFCEFGDVEIINVDGALNTRGRNSNFTIEDIKGNTWIENEFQEISCINIEGDLTIGMKNGDVKIENVTGNLKLENAFGENYIKQIAGMTEIINQNGKIVIVDAAKSLKIENNFGGIVLSNTNADIKIKTENSAVKIKELKKSDIKIDVTNTFGQIDLDIPENYKGAYDLNTSWGKIYIDGEVEKTVYKKDGNTKEFINLKNTNGSIKIRKK